MNTVDNAWDEQDEHGVQDEHDQQGEQGEQQETSKPPLDLEVKVDSPSACERHVTVTISEQDVRRYFDEAFSELMPSAHVPGFRPGRAPRKLVEQRFRNQVADQVKGSLLMDSMRQVSEQAKLATISEPDFDLEAIEVPDEGPMMFEFDVEVRPEFELPQWKGLTLQRPVHEFTDREIDEAIEEFLHQEGSMEAIPEVEQEGDFVLVNAEFRFQGRVLSRLEGELICVRPDLSFSDAMLPGFGELMKGAKPGDRREAKVQVSFDAPAEAARGQEIDVEFEVLGVERTQPTEVSEDTLRELEMETLGELRDAMLERLRGRLQYHQQQKIREQIAKRLTESADWDLPQEMVRRQARRELERAVLELKRSGFSEEEIQARRNELRQNSLQSTERALKEHFILERIAEEESIDATDEDYEREIQTIARQSGESARRVRAQIEKRDLYDALRNQVIERKVIELIASHAEFKDVPFQASSPQVEAIEHFAAGNPESEIPVAKYGDEPQKLPQPADRT